MTKNFYRSMSWLGCLPYAFLAAAIAVAALLAYWIVRDSHVETIPEPKISLTPVQIESIQNIGQWEFLSVSDEELIDTVRHGFFGDDELARIYYGTLRLGIDFEKVGTGWLYIHRDSTVSATLPKVELLDRNFIDEARTKSFFETGKWSDADRKALYDRAYQKMLARCLTPANDRAARESARRGVERLLRGMGFKNIRIIFEDDCTVDTSKNQLAR